MKTRSFVRKQQRSPEEILTLDPYLEAEDIAEALAYAVWRADEFEVTIASP
jgi:uncharacterized protein (DUF433 family)